MNSALKITSEKKQTPMPVTIFHISGWLDAQGEPKLLEAAQSAHDTGVTRLLIDMSELDTLTSAGIRTLQRVYQMYTSKDEQKENLKLCNAHPQIYHVLSITGFLKHIPMYESVTSALESFDND